MHTAVSGVFGSNTSSQHLAYQVKTVPALTETQFLEEAIYNFGIRKNAHFSLLNIHQILRHPSKIVRKKKICKVLLLQCVVCVFGCVCEGHRTTFKIRFFFCHVGPVDQNQVLSLVEDVSTH